MNNDREDGFWWARLTPRSPWDPVQRLRNRWYLAGVQRGLTSDEIYDVGPRIVSPEKPPIDWQSVAEQMAIEGFTRERFREIIENYTEHADDSCKLCFHRRDQHDDEAKTCNGSSNCPCRKFEES